MPDLLLPVVAVHGIGSGTSRDRAGFSMDLVRGVHEAHRPVRRVGPLEDGRKVPRTRRGRGILWEEALWESENDLLDAAMSAYLEARFPALGDELARVADALVDVPAYLGPRGRSIRAAVRRVFRAHPGCVVVAHSLGSVIAADVLGSGGLFVSGLVTLGSPLDLLGLREPMDGPFPFPWHNFYYPQDPVPLGRGLEPARFPGARNHSLGTHEGFVVSHTAYWTSTAVAVAVFRMSVGGEE